MDWEKFRLIARNARANHGAGWTYVGDGVAQLVRLNQTRKAVHALRLPGPAEKSYNHETLSPV